MRITMPQLGESVVEGTISRWLKTEGDKIEQYEPLLEIITDKVNAEYPSPVTGTLTKILVPEGETVAVDVEIAEIAADGQSDVHFPTVEGELEVTQMQPSSESLREVVEEDQPESAAQMERVSSGAVGAAPSASDSRRRFSPAVRRLAQEHGIDLSQVHGTGAGGRVSRQDVEQYLAARAGAAEPPREVARPQEPDFAGAVEAAGTATATPAAAAFAPPMAVTPPPVTQAPRPAPSLAQGDQLIPLSPMRRAIAEHMVRSAYTSPHVTTVIEVDMTPIVKYREQVKETFQQREGVALTFLPFVIKAVVESLKEHPVLNATWTDEGIVLKKNINIGIAVGMEDGLIVPVIHNADEKSLIGLARAVNDLASRARSNRLAPHDVQGGTFTVNNPGTFGTIMSTPIISQPQAAILSTEAIVKRPVVVEGDAIAVRSMMYISLSIDHRVLDGLQAARFLGSVKQRLESFTPESTGL